MTYLKIIATAFILVAYLLVMQGCKKENDDIRKNVATINIVSGNNQSGIYGELLEDTVVLKVSADTLKKFIVTYERVKGNGEVLSGTYSNVERIYPDINGTVKIRWRLGCNSNVQIIKFFVYPLDAVNWQGHLNPGIAPIASVEVTSAGKPPVGWGRSCGFNTNGVVKIFTFDNTKLYMVSNGIYYSADQGVNWDKVESVPYWDDVVDANFNSKGWLYILTRNHGLYYSQNLTTWQSINTGILDYREPIAFTVEDSTLFVSFYFDGLYKSDNNGAFWRKLLVDPNGDRFLFISRHPNGNLYLFDKWSNLLISENNGLNWQRVNVSYSYIHSEVNDFKIDGNGTLYVGSGDATISALSPVTYTGDVYSYYQWNSSSQNVSEIQFFNNNVYYLVSGNPKPGIYSKNNNWDKIELDFDKPINYYYINRDGTFLLASDGGLYYKK